MCEVTEEELHIGQVAQHRHPGNMKHTQDSKSGGTRTKRTRIVAPFRLLCTAICTVSFYFLFFSLSLYLGQSLIIYISRVQASFSVFRKFGHFHEVNRATQI